jgi:cation:H+ antiporter
MIPVLFIIVGLGLLVLGGEFLVRASVALSFKLRLSRMVIGLTVVSFATSAPELLVSVNAALDGFSDISLGNVIGSNIANIGLVLGLTALVSPLLIDRDFYKFNWPVMMALSVVLYVLLLTGNVIERWEGALLFGCLLVYLWALLYRARKEDEGVQGNDVDEALSVVANHRILVWLLLGGVALWGGSELLVNGAIDLATQLGVSERVIAVTMIAVGTSVPELAASLIAAVKQEKAISLGNLIGSNIFNIASVLGITALIQPIHAKSGEVLSNDIFWMLAFAAILIPMAFLPRKFSLGRGKGLILFGGYLCFVLLAFLQ